MNLGPTEEERLRIFLAAELARRALARGLRLNAPEAAALICDEMHWAARAGANFEEGPGGRGDGRSRATRCLEGVPELLAEIRLEVLLEEGTRLVVLRNALGEPGEGGPGGGPAGRGGRRARPRPSADPAHRPEHLEPAGSASRPTTRSGERTSAWSSIARPARGRRLDIPAGTSVRWGPGETKEVTLVAYGGEGAP
ncbi:MAG: hypothetical protein KatS3mg014_1502 [Actinomycetota bacterium]|nr:MAG: hypothetical protein KatS3mg014_1502 [Actinomycetota bacterium]